MVKINKLSRSIKVIITLFESEDVGSIPTGITYSKIDIRAVKLLMPGTFTVKQLED